MLAHSNMRSKAAILGSRDAFVLLRLQLMSNCRSVGVGARTHYQRHEGGETQKTKQRLWTTGKGKFISIYSNRLPHSYPHIFFTTYFLIFAFLQVHIGNCGGAFSTICKALCACLRSYALRSLYTFTVSVRASVYLAASSLSSLLLCLALFGLPIAIAVYAYAYVKTF